LFIILPNFIAIDHAVAKIWHAPSWIFKSSKFEGPVDWRGSVCITMPNFVAIGQADSKMWQFYLFSRWQLSAILGSISWKFLWLVGLRASLGHTVAEIFDTIGWVI